MAIVCNGCGAYIRPAVNVEQQSIRCRQCQAVTPMQVLPLFIVTGASGVGKTAVVPVLRRLLPDWAIFETDVMLGHLLRYANYSINSKNRGCAG